MKIMTIAAEGKGAEELTKAAVELGIVVSLGEQRQHAIPPVVKAHSSTKEHCHHMEDGQGEHPISVFESAASCLCLC